MDADRQVMVNQHRYEIAKCIYGEVDLSLELLDRKMLTQCNLTISEIVYKDEILMGLSPGDLRILLSMWVDYTVFSERFLLAKNLLVAGN